MRTVSVELVAREARRGAERGDAVIVVDVLRCTSSIVSALANGATEVTAVSSVSRARSMKSRNPHAILAGERGGLPPRGFDLGNSPRDFSAGKVKGKSIIITTSSGTQAITNVSNANVVLIGSFLNLTAVANRALEMTARLDCGLTVAASGKLGSFSLEDFICAGGIVNICNKRNLELSDSAYASLLAYQATRNNVLEHVLRGSHAQELVDLGFKGDVALCCEQDKYDNAPFLKCGRIVSHETH